MEILWKGTVSAKFRAIPHQEMRWNYRILRSDCLWILFLWILSICKYCCVNFRDSWKTVKIFSFLFFDISNIFSCISLPLDLSLRIITAQKWCFQLRISSVNVKKFRRFLRIWSHLLKKLHFFTLHLISMLVLLSDSRLYWNKKKIAFQVKLLVHKSPSPDLFRGEVKFSFERGHVIFLTIYYLNQLSKGALWNS